MLAGEFVMPGWLFRHAGVLKDIVMSIAPITMIVGRRMKTSGTMRNGDEPHNSNQKLI